MTEIETSDFKVLGLNSGATLAQVRAARRALSRVHHPDLGGDPVKMVEINRAADLLEASAPPQIPDEGSLLPPEATVGSNEAPTLLSSLVFFALVPATAAVVVVWLLVNIG